MDGTGGVYDTYVYTLWCGLGIGDKDFVKVEIRGLEVVVMKRPKTSQIRLRRSIGFGHL